MTTPKRASYRDGVRWIAQNDEPGGQDVYTVAELVSVLLLADLFGKDPEAVAKAVVACRKRDHVMGGRVNRTRAIAPHARLAKIRTITKATQEVPR